MSIEIIHGKKATCYRAVARIGKKKVSKSFLRKTDAKKWEMEMRVLGSGRGNLQTQELKTPEATLNTLMARFENDHSRIRNANSTRIQNNNMYKNFFAQSFGGVSLKKLTTTKIEAYFIYLKNEKGVSNQRINRLRTLLHALFNQAIIWGMIDSNPISRIRKFPAKDSFAGDTLRYWTKSEADRFLSWLRENDPWLYPKIVVLLHTGIRFGEMAALTAEDVRLEVANPHLRINKSRCRHTGIFQTPKGKRSRMIPLSKGLIEFLRPLVQGKLGNEPLLWKSWEEGRWNTKPSDHFIRAIKESGVRKIRIHDLRHTFAVRFLENKGQIFVLKEILGHQDVKLTMRYSHFSPEMAEQARGIVDFESPKPSRQFSAIDGGLRCPMSHLVP